MISPVGFTMVGNGVIVVRNVTSTGNKVGRMIVQKLGTRKFSTKADRKMLRGSVDNSVSKQEVIKINDFNIQLNIKSIANIKNLVSAYELIKSNPGNMTSGSDKITLDGIDLNYFLKIQERLKAGIYKFPPARRVQISKEGKNETRPLTIASPRDKIVQKAMQLVMNEYYEPKFLDTSHGFRPGRGTHTAIQFMEAKFQSVHYIIEADFSKAFDKIPHNKMMEILRRDIKCQKTLQLINSGAGFIENGKLSDNLSIGTPQGSILSPLLCNIYFHELDIFMEDLINRYNKGIRRSTNKEYTNYKIEPNI
jgi:retron-type reverse transcriptase